MNKEEERGIRDGSRWRVITEEPSLRQTGLVVGLSVGPGHSCRFEDSPPGSPGPSSELRGSAPLDSQNTEKGACHYADLTHSVSDLTTHFCQYTMHVRSYWLG